jgi:hypothetical protein
MFNFRKKSKSEKIPPGFVPADRVRLLLNELGFCFLPSVEDSDLQKNLIDKEGRDQTHGPGYIAKKDILDYLAPIIHQYTSKARIQEAVRFFDATGSG